MTDAPATILITRPRAQAERFARACRAALPEIPVVLSPILDIRGRTGPVALDGVAGVILTSENGVETLAAANDVAGLRAWCVGNRTASAASQRGMHAVSAGGNADDLIDLIRSDAPDGPLLHVHGAEARGDIAARLSAAGLPTREQVIYDQVPRPLGPEALARLSGDSPVVLPLFSPRSADLVGRAAAGARAPLRVAALSPTVARAWSGPEPQEIVVAERPDADAMLRLVAGLCDPQLP